jgi:hypothetical protein
VPRYLYTHTSVHVCVRVCLCGVAGVSEHDMEGVSLEGRVSGVQSITPKLQSIL